VRSRCRRIAFLEPAEGPYIAYLAILSKTGISMQQILRLLQLNLFERRDLKSLFKPPKIEASPQLALL